MPVLKQHIEKQTMIDTNLRKAHLDYLKRFEKLRIAKERRNMQLEEYNAINAVMVEDEEEEEDSYDY
jgi:UDP-N-acetylmuramyl tripeptide synthase